MRRPRAGRPGRQDDRIPRLVSRATPAAALRWSDPRSPSKPAQERATTSLRCTFRSSSSACRTSGRSAAASSCSRTTARSAPGTYNPATFLRALGPEPWNVAYVEPSRRPTDGRYGDNPNRTQQFHQFQVILKPSPLDIQDLYLESLLALGTKPEDHDVRFVEDDWESPTLGAWGLGWQVWLDGLEISQFTYFQQVGGIDCKPVSGELTYGLERICMYLQNVESFWDMQWAPGIGYAELVKRGEWEWSTYNFEQADTAGALRAVRPVREGVQAPPRRSATTRSKKLVLPAYDFVVKGAHAFNVLDARGGHRGHRAPALHRARSRHGEGRWPRRGSRSARRWASRSLTRSEPPSEPLRDRARGDHVVGRRRAGAVLSRYRLRGRLGDGP